MNEELKQAEAKISQLEKTKLKKNNVRYYDKDAPVIPDYEYDRMMQELISLETAYPPVPCNPRLTQPACGRRAVRGL